MKVYVGQIIKHPFRPNLTGTVTDLCEYGKENEAGDYVKVNWHDGTEGSLYKTMVEEFYGESGIGDGTNIKQSPSHSFEIGDEVIYFDDHPISVVGTIYDIIGDRYAVRWKGKFGCTSDFVQDLVLFRKRSAVQADSPQIVENEPESAFLVGERVFYKHSANYPLGVVEYLNLEQQPEPTTYSVRWDNGVYIDHTKNDIGSCAAMIKHLSQPIPEAKEVC